MISNDVLLFIICGMAAVLIAVCQILNVTEVIWLSLAILTAGVWVFLMNQPIFDLFGGYQGTGFYVLQDYDAFLTYPSRDYVVAITLVVAVVFVYSSFMYYQNTQRKRDQ